MIKPPPDDIYDYEPIIINRSEYERIVEYLNVKPWICIECKTKNFGHNENCVYCKVRKGILVPKCNLQIES